MEEEFYYPTVGEAKSAYKRLTRQGYRARRIGEVICVTYIKNDPFENILDAKQANKIAHQGGRKNEE